MRSRSCALSFALIFDGLLMFQGLVSLLFQPMLLRSYVMSRAVAESADCTSSESDVEYSSRGMLSPTEMLSAVAGAGARSSSRVSPYSLIDPVPNRGSAKKVGGKIVH